MSGEVVCGIRIVLDLSSFFDDLRKKCYFFINFSENKIINDVHRGIQTCFGITNAIALKLHDSYLPGNVDVHVLYDEDVIQVIDADRVVTISTNLGKKRKFKNVITEDKVIDVTKAKKKKKEKVKKREDIILEVSDGMLFEESELHMTKKSTSTDSNALGSNAVLRDTHVNLTALKIDTLEKYEDTKASENALDAVESEVGHKIVGTLECPYVESCVLDPDLLVTKTINVCDADKFPVNNLNKNAKENKPQSEKKEKDTEDQENSRKKRRRRKRKSVPKDINLTSDHNYSAQSLNVAPVVVPVVVNGLRTTPKHIKFTDDVNAEGHCAYSNECQYDNSGGNYEINRSVPIQLSGNPALGVDNANWKNRDSSQSKTDTTSASTSSSCADNSELICGNIAPKGNSTPLIFECKRVSRTLKNPSVKKENEINFSKYPVLRDCPKVNDIIAFKKWKMDENYCPGISKYISAKVLKISEEGGTMNLKILNGHTEFKEPQGKFSLDSQETEDDVESEETLINDVCMNVVDLLEIRLIFP